MTGAMNFVADISAQKSVPSCASEAIDIPGSIQPHGLILLFDFESGNLAHWAGDFDRIIGKTPTVGCGACELLGASLDELLGSRELGAGEEAAYVADIRPPGRPSLTVQAHRSGHLLVVELQETRAKGSPTLALEQVRGISDRIAVETTLAEASHAAVEEVRSITGFDRVMIYRFLEDGSGSVIAETRAANTKAYFNHRFPSSDIPSQARELYRRSLIRSIPDVTYTPSPIVPPADHPIDMSHCVLRSVSPVHIQYLKNMEVGASMSVSLIVDGELWGLIACHHATPRSVSVDAQLLCRHVARSLSAFILSCGQAEAALLEGLQREAVESALRSLRSSPDPDRTIRTSAAQLKGLIPCGGFALLAEGELVAGSGRIPPLTDLRNIAPRIEEQLKGRDTYWTDCVSKSLPGVPSICVAASGVMAARLDASEPLSALWFRPEQVEEIQWAGDPTSKDATNETLGPLSPRRSFATWCETVRGRSRPWMWYETNAIELFQSRAAYIMQRHRLAQVNIQLGQANAELSELATTDPLTGLPNRRLFDERFDDEWQNAARHEKLLGLVAIDVDHFKQYNDLLGHPAGDECLQQVARAIEAALRTIDLAARVGGEEFAILLPDTDARSTATVAERVRRNIEQLGLEHPRGVGGIVTISVGTAVGSPALLADASIMTCAADRALYAAKAGGRNRVSVSD